MASPLTHTTLSKLIKLLLKKVDSYNSTDLSISTDSEDQDSAGEQARICLNLSLQKMYALIKDSRFMEAYPTTSLHQTEGQDFIELDDEATLDDIEAITDTTNNNKLIKKSWNWYRRAFPNPADATGEPVYYIRRGSRVYLAPRAIDNRALTIDFRKKPTELKIANDTPYLPSQYDFWIIAESCYSWFATEDPEAVPQVVINDQKEARQIAIAAIYPDDDSSLQSGSCIDRISERYNAWNVLKSS